MNSIPLFFSPTLCSRNGQGPGHVVDLLHNPLHATTTTIIIILPWLIFFHKWSSWIIALIDCKLHLNWIYSQHNIWTGWGWFPVQLHLFYLLIMLCLYTFDSYLQQIKWKLRTTVWVDKQHYQDVFVCSNFLWPPWSIYTDFNWMSHLWRWLRCVYTWIYLLCLRG